MEKEPVEPFNEAVPAKIRTFPEKGGQILREQGLLWNL